MRKLLLLSAIIAITWSGFTQNFPIDTLNSSWIERNEHGDSKNTTVEYFRYFMDGDTIFDDQKFFKIYEEEDGRNVKYMGAFREEEGKVYYKGSDYWDFNIDSVVLLYDFTAEIDDTVQTGAWQEYVIADIDSVMVDGQLRKRMLTNWGQYWIEGIGSLSGFLYPVSEIPISYWSVWISCYYINNEMVYHNSEFHDCYTLVGTDDIQLKDEIIVAPNPAQKGQVLRIENIPENSKLTVVDMSGKMVVVHKSKFENYLNLDTSRLPKGVYLMQVTAPQIQIVKKIIIQ